MWSRPEPAYSPEPRPPSLQPDAGPMLEKPNYSQPADSEHENIWCCYPLSLGVVCYMASLQQMLTDTPVLPLCNPHFFKAKAVFYLRNSLLISPQRDSARIGVICPKSQKHRCGIIYAVGVNGVAAAQ